MKLAILLLSLSIPIHGLSELPNSSQSLVSKLSEWEVEQTEKLQLEINEKRREVVTVLKQHLTEATKSGNLDVAIAIKAEIERLSPKSKELHLDLNSSFEEWLTHVQFRTVKDEIWRINGNKLEIEESDGKKSLYDVVVDPKKSKFSFVYGPTWSEYTLIAPDRKSGKRFGIKKDKPNGELSIEPRESSSARR